MLRFILYWGGGDDTCGRGRSSSAPDIVLGVRNKDWPPDWHSARDTFDPACDRGALRSMLPMLVFATCEGDGGPGSRRLMVWGAPTASPP